MKRSHRSCVLSICVLFTALAFTGCGVSESPGLQTSAICDPDLYAEGAPPDAYGREQMQCHAMTISNECTLSVGIERAVSQAGFLANFDHGMMECLGNAPEADITQDDVATACDCISASAFAECMTCPTCDCMSH